MAPTVELHIHDGAFNFPLPEGMAQVTASELKKLLKDSFKLLYHEKVKFSVKGELLEDGDAVPVSPMQVHVGGPTAVVNMLELALKKHGRPSQQASREPARAEPLRQAPQVQAVASQPQRPPSSLAQPPQRLPSSLGQQPQRLSPQSFPQQQQQQRTFPLPYAQARQPPSRASPDSGVAVPSTASGAARPTPASVSYWTSQPPSAVPSTLGFEPWGGGGNFSPQQALASVPHLLSQQQQDAALAEELELQRALQASRMLAMADEEEQLRWALEESARLAEVERRGATGAEVLQAEIDKQTPKEIQAYYEEELAKKKVPSDKSQSTVEPHVVGPHACDSDDDGSAWGSVGEDAAAARGGETGSDDDEDEELPPLELIPNSEE